MNVIRNQFIVWLLIVVVLMVSSFPWIWLLITSVKPASMIADYPPRFVFNPTFNNFIQIVRDLNFLHYLQNSVIIASGTTLLTLLLGATGAYSISRFNTGGKGLLFSLIATRMIPPIVLVIPYYYIMRIIGLLHTHFAIILSHLVYSLPFTILLLKVVYDNTATEQEESAFLDGCSRLMVFVRISLPLIAPILIATSIFTFIFSWNEFLFVMILGSSNPLYSTETIPVLMAELGVGTWGIMGALGVISILPVLIFSYILQRYLKLHFIYK